jgi:hypothetical protein
MLENEAVGDRAVKDKPHALASRPLRAPLADAQPLCQLVIAIRCATAYRVRGRMGWGGLS